MAKFQPGQSGNPRGAPKGVTSTLAKVRRLIAPFAEELTERTLADALAGDQAAARTCLEVFVATSVATRKPAKQEPLQAD